MRHYQLSVSTTKVHTRISQVSQFNACRYCDNNRNGPAALVLAGLVFSPGKKIEVHLYKKQVVKKSASVICWTC